MKYPSYCCQKCGEMIGWLGRIMPFHKCKEKNKMIYKTIEEWNEHNPNHIGALPIEVCRQIWGKKSDGAYERGFVDGMQMQVQRCVERNVLGTSCKRSEHWVGLMRGVRVEGDTVIISVKGGNAAARELCGVLIEEMNK